MTTPIIKLGSKLDADANISELTNDSGFITGIGALSINALSDVDTTGLSTNQVLRYNGTNFVPYTLVGGGDVTGGSNLDGGVGVFESKVGGNLRFKSLLAGTGISITGGSESIEISSTIGSLSLTDLADVTISAPAAGKYLRYTGAEWVDVVPTKLDIGLGNVDNTSDMSKPVSTAMTSALSMRAPIDANVSIFTNDAGYVTALSAPVTSVNSQTGSVVLTKNHVGLNNVDNTSDINKPISTATQTALNGKAATGANVSIFINDAGYLTSAPVSSVNGQTGVVVITKTNVSLGNVDNTSDINKPISTATQAALNAKANIGGNVSVFTNDSGFITGIGALSINALSDVDTTGLATNQVLRYNGSQFVPYTIPASSTTWGSITGTLSSQTDLQSALDAKSATSHNHTGVYANVAHTHVISDITSLQTSLDAKVATASNLGAGTGVFESKVGVDLRFKSLVAGTNVTLSNDANTITINATGGGGGGNLDSLTDVVITSPTNRHTFVYNGTNWVNEPGITVETMTSTQAFSAVTYANVTQLVSSVVANATYRVDAFITFQSAATTTGIGIQLLGPTGSTFRGEIVVPITSTAAASQLRIIFPNTTSTNSATVLGTGVTAINSNHTCLIRGIVEVTGTAGTIQILAASEVAASAVTLQIGSKMIITRLL